MRELANNAAGASSLVHRMAAPADEFAAFDSLPASLRQFFQYAPINGSAAGLLVSLQMLRERGVWLSEAEALRALAREAAEEIVAFAREYEAAHKRAYPGLASGVAPLAFEHDRRVRRRACRRG